MATGGTYKRTKEPLIWFGARVQVLRVPLDPNKKCMSWCLDRLDNSIWSDRTYHELWSHRLQCLMMTAVHTELMASNDSGEMTFWNNRYGMYYASDGSIRLMVLGPRQLGGNILDQTASECHIDCLHAPADSKQG